MAKCGCGGGSTGCSCKIISGTGVVVTGSGTPTNPYRVSASATSTQPTRKTVSHTTTVLAAGASENSTIAMATGFRLLKITSNKAARIELYSSMTDLLADVNRQWGTDPAPGLGLVLDYLVTGSFDGDLSPLVDGMLVDSTAISVPIRITSTFGGAVTVGFTWLRTE